MPTQLVRACVLLAVLAGAALAADPPKGKKEKPTTELPPITIPVGSGGLGNLGVGKAAEPKFVVSKPVGSWFKDVQLENLACRVVLTIQEDRLAIECEMTDNKDRVTMRLDADYAINKEGCLFGVIDTFETNLPQVEELGDGTKLSGQPYSFRFRADGTSLSLKEFKGLGVGWSADGTPENTKRVISYLCGRYTAVDPAKPLPVLKRSAEDIRRSEEKEQRERERWSRLAPTLLGAELNTPKADPEPKKMDDPAPRQDQLLHQEFDSWQPGATPAKPRPMTPPDAPRPERIHGGILKADPPKVTEEDLRVVGEAFRQIWNCVCPVKFGDSTRLGGVPYPTPHYLEHYPKYYAPDPAFPLQERDSMLDPTGEIRRGNPNLLPTTSAYVGSVSGAVAALQQQSEVVQAKAEVVAEPRLLPAVMVEQPKCEPPTDAEVMAAFKAKQAKADKDDFELFHEDVVIVKNNVKDEAGPPRFYPLVGVAQTHCCQWECTVNFTDRKTGKAKAEVIRLDSQKMRLVEPQGDVSIPQRMREK